MKLLNIIKRKQLRNHIKAQFYYKLLCLIPDDDIQEYCIDTDLLTDYYNEEPDYEDYRHDLW